jgi:formate hydrogenlyase subunit 4
MTAFYPWLFLLSGTFILPPLVIGLIRKTKARMQNRVGAPLFQLFFDLIKLSTKKETLSETMSGAFRLSTCVVLAINITLAWLMPWLGYQPWSPAADIFLIVYMLAFARVWTLLGALDSGSTFGAFGASREVTISLLVEPALILALVALALHGGNTNLKVIFDQAITTSPVPGLWAAAGLAILGASLVELSRMPVDDPTTHLELTMIHEAMILESSGRNLALVELSQALRMTVFFGLATQCFLRIIPQFWSLSPLVQASFSVAAILLLAIFVGLMESLLVKLQWRKVPEFIAYVMSFGLLAVMLAVAEGAPK